MNQEKISELIKDLRKKNNLTQAQFANLFHVTYQAVSKWENGKNMPDIDTLKNICEYYDLNIQDFLSGNVSKKKKNNIFIYITIVLVISIGISLFFIFKPHTFEFKTLSTSCNNFNITGSIAYNDKKSSIYISHIDYCGGNDTTIYESINCTLYETHDNTKTQIEFLEKKESSTLEEFLKEINILVNDYQCEQIYDHTFHLEIQAIDSNEKTTSYNIPLNFETCNSTES